MTVTDLAIFGGRDEIKELGFRLQKMMPSAQSFTADEALAVAQIAHAHQLDPFNGEVWGIKRADTGQWYGVMVGIKGLRKCARRAATAENSSYWLDFVRVEPQKYHITEKDAVVYESHLRDAANMSAYGQAVHALVDAGIPYQEAIKMVGPAPVVIGVGVAHPGERSKMGLHQRAKKRAEADALKTRYDVDFGSAKLTVEDEGDIVDAHAENLPDAFALSVDAEFPPDVPETAPLDVDEAVGILMGEPPKSKATPRPDETEVLEVLGDKVLKQLVALGLFKTPKEAAQTLSKLFPTTRKAPFGKILEAVRAA